jgi:hypothetical protein
LTTAPRAIPSHAGAAVGDTAGHNTAPTVRLACELHRATTRLARIHRRDLRAVRRLVHLHNISVPRRIVAALPRYASRTATRCTTSTSRPTILFLAADGNYCHEETDPPLRRLSAAQPAFAQIDIVDWRLRHRASRVPRS